MSHEAPGALLTAARPQALALMLDVQRDEVGRLCTGLDEDAARTRLVPSATTPAGLLKHLTFVEKVWFHTRVGGLTRDQVGIGTDVDSSFRLEPGDTVAGLLAQFRQTCEQSRRFCADAAPEDRYDWRGSPVTLHFIQLHCIQEYARHCGHGDILREQLLAEPAAG